ncbi:ParB/RepB/Spo0J family partition protein [Motiliproteus coralliicola]|uniref:Probable chromosome-partitioning protein ParB n=1 Tax=Motiliproteus coralliicola TaxID=2283196 RepID=A0A369WBX8_9GAMM|nr:ParB/RepB/Spo0J family partition protein [Motiliproteus coralliicola]RDE18821.1 ParB/RepB/Spo0J family partition protein [Motiliproteus coralliicola]
MVKKRGLGRGLDALLGGAPMEESPVELTATEPSEALQALPVDKIQRGIYQPRRDMDQAALEELASSIRAQGVIQPIVVRPVDMGRYEIIAGERRWRAAQMAGLTEIPTCIREVPDEAAIAMALIENIQREDLNPIEEAMALQRLIDEFELTQQKVAEAVGKSRSAVTNLLRLMKLMPEVKRMLEYGDLEMGHARALLALDGEKQITAAKEVVARGLSVRQTEEFVKQFQASPKKTEKPEPDPGVEQLQQRWRELLGMQVRINHSEKGDGKLTISYRNLEEVESILQRMQ